MNGRLVEQSYYDMSFLEENRYFDAYRAKGYAIRTYQSDSTGLSPPGDPSVTAQTYKVDDLKVLHSFPTRWTERFSMLFHASLRPKELFRGVVSRVGPLKTSLLEYRSGPVSLSEVWPDRLLEDYRRATENTLFVAHLLIPHFPFVYRSDGSLINVFEWDNQGRVVYYEGEESAYWEKWRAYGEQLQWLATQLDSFLKDLSDHPGYDSTTVIIHGDHGPRLRLLNASDSERFKQLFLGRASLSLYEYEGKRPDPQELLNRFATLFAIKRPGAMTPSVSPVEGSVVYLLQQETGIFAEFMDTDAINSVYQFNPDGSPRAISIRDAWRDLDRDPLQISGE